MNRWLSRDDVPRGAAYDERWEVLAASGANVHGEADLVCELLAEAGFALGGSARPAVLDAGCGTGRVGTELARRGAEVVGVDVDPAMLASAARKAPDLAWVLADLASLDLRTGGVRRRFQLIAAPGNVMIFLAPGSEGRVLTQLAAHLEPGGLLVAGFQLGETKLPLTDYDEAADAAGMQLLHRWSTWDRAPFDGGDYAVSVHRNASAR